MVTGICLFYHLEKEKGDLDWKSQNRKTRKRTRILATKGMEMRFISFSLSHVPLGTLVKGAWVQIASNQCARNQNRQVKRFRKALLNTHQNKYYEYKKALNFERWQILRAMVY